MSENIFNDPNVTAGMQLFMLRGAYGYKGFSEKIADNMYKSDSIAFREAIENSKEPFDVNKVSELSIQQKNILNKTSAGNALIPLLNRMGELGMIDLRKELINPEIINRVQKNAYQTKINAYQNGI